VTKPVSVMGEQTMLAVIPNGASSRAQDHPDAAAAPGHRSGRHHPVLL